MAHFCLLDVSPRPPYSIPLNELPWSSTRSAESDGTEESCRSLIFPRSKSSYQSQPTVVTMTCGKSQEKYSDCVQETSIAVCGQIRARGRQIPWSSPDGHKSKVNYIGQRISTAWTSQSSTLRTKCLTNYYFWLFNER